MSARIAVRATFSASHRDHVRRELHGHSYVVWAWFRRGDQVVLQGRLNAVLAAHFDHRTLADRLSRGEALAADIRRRLRARGVEVSRPVEGFKVRVGVCD
jgi:hypothetical protein